MSTKATRWFGMHFYDGLVGYKDPESGDAFTILVKDEAIRAMDKTFDGLPVFIEHVDEVNSDIDQLRSDAAGFVVRSFYNDADGKHWVEFMVASDEADTAIANGYGVSNCYIPQAFGPGGMCNNVPYDKEMTDGTYHHLALVKNPRYNESVVLSPEQFREYNASKTKDLLKYANSHNSETKDNAMGFEFFTKQKIKNSDEILNHMVTLPKSKLQVSIQKLCNDADTMAAAGGMTGASIMVDGESMTVQELIDRYCSLKAEIEDLADDDDGYDDSGTVLQNEADDSDDGEEDDSDSDGDKKGKKAPAPAKKNDDKKKNGKKVSNSREPTAAELAIARMKKEKNERVKNAVESVDESNDDDETVVDTYEDTRARGRARYGRG